MILRGAKLQIIIGITVKEQKYLSANQQTYF
jgi:hypothetical protein